jgi:hypothetical protein
MSKEIIKIDKNNINSYYKKVNDAIDKYFDDHKVRPSSIKRFLKPNSVGMVKFIEMNDFKNIKGIEMIIRDVVDDRNSMEEDGVLTFESFHSVNEDHVTDDSDVSSNFIYSLIDKPLVPIKYEKVIADKYNISLGHVEPFDLNKHEYNVEIPGSENLDIFILSSEDLAKVKESILSNVYDSYGSDNMKFGDIDIVAFSDFLVNKEEFVKISTDKLSDDKLINIIDEMMRQEDYSDGVSYKEFHIWER